MAGCITLLENCWPINCSCRLLDGTENTETTDVKISLKTDSSATLTRLALFVIHESPMAKLAFQSSCLMVEEENKILKGHKMNSLPTYFSLLH